MRSATARPVVWEGGERKLVPYPIVQLSENRLPEDVQKAKAGGSERVLV